MRIMCFAHEQARRQGGVGKATSGHKTFGDPAVAQKYKVGLHQNVTLIFLKFFPDLRGPARMFLGARCGSRRPCP